MKKHLLKTLLVAAGMCAGSLSAWADSQTASLTESVVATLYPSNEVANYFDFVAMAKTWNDAAEGDKATYQLTAGESGVTVNKVSLSQVSVPSSLTMFYAQAIGTSGNGYFQWRWDTSSNKYGLFNFGNARTLAIAVSKGQIIVMEGSYTTTATGSCAATYVANRGYNTFTATEDGYIAFNLKTANVRALAILNPSASAVSYTVKYVDEEGTEIKESTEGTGDPGASITIIAAEKASFKNDGETKKYIYKSDDSEGKTIASDGSTVVTITFREAATWDYTVNAMNGETRLEELATGSAFEHDAIIVPFHKYYNINGTLYQKGANSSEYKETVTIDEDDKVAELAYTASDKTNVVFFKEAEDIETLTTTSTNGTNTRCSFAQGGYANEDALITTLTPGKYVLTGAGYGGNLVFKAGETEVLNMETAGYWRETVSEEFTIFANTDVTFKGGASGGGASLDYVIIQKKGDVVTLTLGAESGDSYKSYVTTGNTDFATQGVTAYIAKAADIANGKVTLSTIDTAPAGIPVLLKGTKGDNVVISTTSTIYSAPATNLLVAADGSTAIGASEAKYVLAYDDKWEFRHFNGTLSAGKVYLDLSEVAAPGVRPVSFSFEFEEEATGINAVNAGQTTVEGCYNLQGQRVAQPAKGLYIVNGKKVIIK